MVGFSPSWSCIYVVVGMIDDDKNSGWLVGWLVDSISLPISLTHPTLGSNRRFRDEMDRSGIQI